MRERERDRERESEIENYVMRRCMLCTYFSPMCYDGNQFEEDEMGGTCSTNGERDIHIKFSCKKCEWKRPPGTLRRWNGMKVVISKCGCKHMNCVRVRFEVLTAVLLKVKSSGMLCCIVE
jgi:hypothetical protein